MKTRYKILLTIIAIIAILLVTLVALDQYFIAAQDREIKESTWVKDCKLPGEHDVVPWVGIYNYTHGFDLRTCMWYPADGRVTGLIESIYSPFMET